MVVTLSQCHIVTGGGGMCAMCVLCAVVRRFRGKNTRCVGRIESLRKLRRLGSERERVTKTFESEIKFLIRVVQMCAKKPPMGST